MSDDTPSPDEALPPTEPAADAPAAATEPEIPVAATPPPAATASAATAATVPSGHVAVPKWLLVTVAALLAAALMFGVGYAVGDRTGEDDRGASDQPARNGMPRDPFGHSGSDDRGGRAMPGFPGPGSLGGGSGSQGGSGGQGGSGTQPRPAPSGAFLGVATQQTANGVEVTQVVSGGAAGDAGIQVGDVITEFDGNAVTTPAQLANAVRNAEPGDSVRITYERNGQSRTVEVTLGSRTSS